MYNVIIVLDEKRNKSYYYSYVEKGGNIKCADLPPYQDINRARSCYWDADASAWICDTDKYAEIVAAQAAKKAAEEQAQREAEAVLGNADLTLAVMELADRISMIVDAVPGLAGEAAVSEGGE